VVGTVAHRFSAVVLCWVGLGIGVLGATSFAIPKGVVASLGLLVLGFGLAPVFPALVTETPSRTHVSDAAFGVLFAAGGVGGIVLSALSGLVTTIFSVEVVPVVVLTALILLVALQALAASRCVGPARHP
jgi:fucose permease